MLDARNIIDTQLLQEICDQLAGEIKAIVTIVAEHGKIVASSRRSRIGDMHQKAAAVMIGESNALAVTKEEAAADPTILEGALLPIDFAGERLFCVGVAAPLQIARPYARMIQLWVIALLRENLGEPHIQNRGDGRWILVSEHRTHDGGTVDKYVGDGIVIFFGDPDPKGVKQDALGCVKMALAMRERMRTLRRGWREAGLETPLECRIGINTGFCTVGNFGSEERMDYTIVGSGVNLASRLETAAETGGILISNETYALVKDEIHCEEHGRLTFKGVAYPVSTYEVVDAYENLGQSSTLITEDHPNLKLNIDLGTLSAGERAEIETILRQALDSLSGPPADK